MRLIEFNRKEIRTAVQKGGISNDMNSAVRANITKLINKYAKGDNWNIEDYYSNIDLFYTGSDPKELTQVQDTLMGEIYDYFQKGPQRDITRTKKVKDDEFQLKYEVSPMRDQDNNKNKAQIFFIKHKRIASGDIAITVTIR